MSTFLTPPVWYDKTGNKIDILNNATYTSVGSENTAIGTSAIAGNPSGGCYGAVAVGSYAEATAPLSIAIGSYDDNSQTVQALGTESIAIGGGAIVNADATYGIAIGSGAKVVGNGSIAIGLQAEASVQGGIAIGASAYAEDSNVIQLGNNNTAYTLSIGNGRMSLNIGSTAQNNWVSATSNNISQGLYLVRYDTYMSMVYLMAPITFTASTEGGYTPDWHFSFDPDPQGLRYYLRVSGPDSTASSLSITPVYYDKSTSTFKTMSDGASVMLFKIL